ncbi:MAG: hypothetical protein LBH29_07740, partial [Elusimicrobiota bacterium]|nr:hypothetical protein [Elusimicrobiota bacterium]
MKKNILLSFLFIFLFFETADSRHSLIVNGLSGAPLFEFDIADSAGEYYALGQNPQGDEFFWNLVPQHNNAIQNAAFYWANLLGNSPSNSAPVKISIGLFNYLNDSAIADYGANGSGRTTLVNAIYGNTADSLIDPAGNPSYNDTAFAQIQIGVLCFPWLDYMGQSIEELGYVWNDTSGWSFEDMRLLPNNGLTDGMVSVLVHELGHAMGIMSFEYYKYGGNDLYFQEYDGVNLNKFDFYLYDSFGNRAQANQKVRLSDFIDYTASDFRIIRQGDSSLSDSEQSGFAFFQGPETLAVLDGAIHSVNNPNNVVGLPIRGFEGENSDLSHLELRNSMMSHQNWRNWNTFMEAELALLQDIGIPIDRKNFFGRSIYKDNANISVSDNFYKRNDAGTAYLSGQYNLTPWTIGLHIYGTNNTVSMNGEVLQSGDASAGIRIDGWNNKLSIGSSAKIYSNGRDNSALLVSYGKEHNIILRGQLTSMGAGGIGARFDFGDNVLGDMYEYRGSYMRRRASFDPDASVNPYWNPFSWDMDALLPELEGALVSKFDITGTLKGNKAALYIARNAFVKEINVMRGAELEGEIISDWSPTFNFSAVDDIFNYVQYYSGYIIIGGNVYLNPGNLEDLKTKLTFGYLPNTSGEKTNSADSAFNLTYNGDISAKGYIDIEIAGGNLNYGGTIKGVSKILKSSLGNFTMRGDGSKFDGIFEQTAGNTEIALTGKMFGGQNYIYDSVLTVNSSNTGYNLNVGSNAQLRHYN